MDWDLYTCGTEKEFARHVVTKAAKKYISSGHIHNIIANLFDTVKSLVRQGDWLRLNS